MLPVFLIQTVIPLWQPEGENHAHPSVFQIFRGCLNPVAEGLGSDPSHHVIRGRFTEVLFSFLCVQPNTALYEWKSLVYEWESGFSVLTFERGSGILGPVFLFFSFLNHIYLALFSDGNYHRILGLFQIAFGTCIYYSWLGRKTLAREDFKAGKSVC